MSIAKLRKIFPFVLVFCLGIFLSSFTQHKISQKNKIVVTSYPRLDYGNFSVVYDSKNKVPLFAHEHISAQMLESKVSRNQLTFSKDPNVYQLHQSSLRDYQRTGFDRGHMAAAANHQYSKEALANTYYLTNICPQNANLNRGLWSKLERVARSYVDENQEVDVISGPLFLPIQENGCRYIHYSLIGQNDVAIPTHFFKVIITQSEWFAYIIPNENVSEITPLESYQVTIDILEKVSGLQFKRV